MNRLAIIIGSFVTVISLQAQSSVPKREPYLPALRSYLELTPLQTSLLIDANRVYTHFLIDRDIQIADLKAKILNPQHELSWRTFGASIPELCTEVEGFAGEIREHNTRVLDDEQKEKIDYLIDSASSSISGREELVREARAANLLASPAVIEHVTVNVARECGESWLK